MGDTGYSRPFLKGGVKEVQVKPVVGVWKGKKKAKSSAPTRESGRRRKKKKKKKKRTGEMLLNSQTRQFLSSARLSLSKKKSQKRKASRRKGGRIVGPAHRRGEINIWNEWGVGGGSVGKRE